MVLRFVTFFSILCSWPYACSLIKEEKILLDNPFHCQKLCVYSFTNSVCSNKPPILVGCQNFDETEKKKCFLVARQLASRGYNAHVIIHKLLLSTNENEDPKLMLAREILQAHSKFCRKEFFYATYSFSDAGKYFAKDFPEYVVGIIKIKASHHMENMLVEHETIPYTEHTRARKRMAKTLVKTILSSSISDAYAGCWGNLKE